MRRLVDACRAGLTRSWAAAHPGAQFIEKNTLRRIKRESHEVHEAERKAKVDALEKEQEAAGRSFEALEAQVAALSAGGDSSGAAAAKAELWAAQQAIDKRAAELAKLQRERKFNADELCYVAQEKSLVGRRVAPCSNGL